MHRHGAVVLYSAGVGVLFGVYVGVTNSTLAVVLGIACMAIGGSSLARADRRGAAR